MDEHGKSRQWIRDGRLSPATGAGVIAVVTLIVYLPVLWAGYIWDDDTALTENPLIRSLSGLFHIWFSTKPYDYFPLTFTSFWVEWRLWGANPMGYHVVNVLLHGLGAILFWRVLLRLKIPGAWLAAMVFAVHPVCVASVAWVAERKNTLSLVFYMLSILWYLRQEDQSIGRPVAGGSCRTPSGKLAQPTSHLTMYYWLSLLAFLLALLSKTSVVTLPFAIWLCVWWRRTQESRESKAKVRKPNRLPPSSGGSSLRYSAFDPRLLLQLAPFFALALVLGLVTVWFQSHRAMSGNLYQRDGLGVRLLGGSWAVWFYLWKSLLPIKLSMIYPRWAIHPTSVVAYIPAVLGLLAALTCWVFRRTWGKGFLFGLGYFCVTLLPVLGFFDMSFFVYSRVADHLQYLALPGVIALAVGIASSKFSTQSSKIAAAGLLILLGLSTFNRARVFKGQESLWRDTLAKNTQAWPAYNNLGMATKDPVEEFNCYLKALQLNPNYVDAHNNLGVVLYQQGKTAEAIFHFREAIRLQPTSAPARNNLGGVLMNQGKTEEAMLHLRQAVRINPNYAQAQNNLGLALIRLGQPKEAAIHFEALLRLQPGQYEAHFNLGNIFFNEGRAAEAATHYRAALRARPDSYEAHYNFGVALGAMGQLNEALAEFTATLKLKPDFGPAQIQLAEVLLKQGRQGEALGWLTAAAQHQPDSPEVRFRFGTTLAEAQRASEAVPQLREALRLKPDWPEALCSLAWLLSTQSDPKLRDGGEAVRLATQANQLTGGTNVNVLDTLAAAHAESGQFEEATRAAQKALELARATGRTNFATEVEMRLGLYEASRPFRGNLNWPWR